MLGSIISALLFACICYFGYKYLHAHGFVFPWDKTPPAPPSGRGGSSGSPPKVQ